LGSGMVVAAIAAVKLLVHLYAGRHYGYFVDELYYMACAQHLDWGYVDQPPLIAFVAWAVRHVLGDSLPAIRLLPALAGAGQVLLTGLVARELGGGRFAQGFAALATLVAPGFLAFDSFFSMNAFEPLFWTGCAYVLIRIVNTGDQRLWLWFGVLAGVGLENKHSMLTFGFALVAGVLLTPERKAFRAPWIWLAGLVAFLIFLPNLWWNIQHHFPFLELQANIRRSGRNVPLSPLAFFGQQITSMLPLSLPIWLAGLWYYLFAAEGKPFRALGWAWLITAGAIVLLNPRTYYLWPAFAILLAAGGVQWERWLEGPRWQWVKPVWCALMVLLAVAAAPLFLPVVRPETYIRYVKAIHYEQPRIETHRLGPLPQLFADEFGWEEMAVTVARVYNSLPPEVRAKTFAQSYGQAGAIDLFGPKYGLPRAISGHQSYFLWGPRDYTGETMILIGISKQGAQNGFASVEVGAEVKVPYAPPWLNGQILLCRHPVMSLQQAWPRLVRFH